MKPSLSAVSASSGGAVTARLSRNCVADDPRCFLIARVNDDLLWKPIACAMSPIPRLLPERSVLAL